MNEKQQPNEADDEDPKVPGTDVGGNFSKSDKESSDETMLNNVMDTPLNLTDKSTNPGTYHSNGNGTISTKSELPAQLEKDLVQVFKLLADETRLRVLMYLQSEGELHVSALCERLQQSQPAVSHHLALLRVAGLIEARRDGKHNFYSVRASKFHELMGELFTVMASDGQSEIRFEDFTLSCND